MLIKNNKTTKIKVMKKIYIGSLLAVSLCAASIGQAVIAQDAVTFKHLDPTWCRKRTPMVMPFKRQLLCMSNVLTYGHLT